MELLFTRHGQTDWNLAKKVQGKADIPLNETGKKQAKIVKEQLESEPIDLIVCSPLARAVETAKIINSGRNIPMYRAESLSERDFGEFDYEGFWSYRENKEYQKAENIQAFFQRVYGFLDALSATYPDKRILLVAHGGISIPVYCYFNGIPEQETLLGLALGNCEVAKYKEPEKEQEERE